MQAETITAVAVHFLQFLQKKSVSDECPNLLHEDSIKNTQLIAICHEIDEESFGMRKNPPSTATSSNSKEACINKR